MDGTALSVNVWEQVAAGLVPAKPVHPNKSTWTDEQDAFLRAFRLRPYPVSWTKTCEEWIKHWPPRHRDTLRARVNELRRGE